MLFPQSKILRRYATEKAKAAKRRLLLIPDKLFFIVLINIC